MNSLQTIERKRDKRVDLEGTAPFIFLNSGDIAVDTDGGGNIIDFTEESKTAKYYPFDFLEINNSSSSDLNIYINQNRKWKKLVRAGTILPIKDFKGIRNIRISKRNASVTIVAGEVETTVMRQSLTDDEYRRRQLSVSPIRKLILKFIGV